MSVAPSRIVSTLVAATAQFVNGAALDLVALADVKAELNLTVTTFDAWLAQTITRRSQTAQRFCNRTLLVQTYVETVFGFTDPYPWQLPGRSGPLQLSNWPIAATPSPAGTAPPIQPAAATGGASSLPARTYSIRLTYLTASGETAGSPPLSLTLGANTLAALAAPGLDAAGLATGYNVYASTTPGSETKQNASPIAVTSGWSEPSSGLIAGAALPPYILIAENAAVPFATAPIPQTPLAEGRDYFVNANAGQVVRLDLGGRPRLWSATPTLAIYPAGYTAATIPADLQDAVIQLVKARYYARNRDPMLRSQNVEGVLETTYALTAGMGTDGDLPMDVEAMLQRYRTPVMG